MKLGLHASEGKKRGLLREERVIQLLTSAGSTRIRKDPEWNMAELVQTVIGDDEAFLRSSSKQYPIHLASKGCAEEPGQSINYRERVVGSVEGGERGWTLRLFRETNKKI
ncbi:hypothetical protein QYF36_024278 [Acer negundo]|nr:hypothetical protein QYF36_024278 [Acer negundo]